MTGGDGRGRLHECDDDDDRWRVWMAMMTGGDGRRCLHGCGRSAGSAGGPRSADC